MGESRKMKRRMGGMVSRGGDLSSAGMRLIIGVVR